MAKQRVHFINLYAFERVIALVDQLAELAEWVDVPVDKIQKLLTDEDDNVIVACAIEGKANYLVTYDPHFDSLGEEYKGIKIMKAIPFLNDLRNS